MGAHVYCMTVVRVRIVIMRRKDNVARGSPMNME